MKQQINLIIDTDIGDDIDDALAIAFALNCPEIRLLGVTTVFGHTEARAKIAKHLLATAGRLDIPVHAGCGQPINEAKNLGDIPCQYIESEMAGLPVSETHAVDYLIRTVMQSPEPVTLLAIGPMTNVAAALLKEPGLKHKLERIVIMGGAYYFHFVEWNVKCDPEAANLVFQSGVPLTAVGLDVTKRCLMDRAQLAQLEASDAPTVRLLQRLIHGWQRDTGRECPILHDALAVYGVFGREYLHFEQEVIAVELAGRHTRGMTFNLTDRDREEQLVKAAAEQAAGSVVHAAKRVDKDGFIPLFLGRLLDSGTGCEG